MKALLICPADRPGVARIADATPLAAAPLLGKPLVEYWLEALVARGATHVIVLAVDRPNHLRQILADGARWGLRIDLFPETRELTPTEALTKYRRTDDPDGWLAEGAIVIDHLPGRPDLPLCESYAGWFAAARTWMPHALTPARIGAREVRPGVRLGLRSRISPRARLTPPCWIGEDVFIADDAVIGPEAMIDDRVVVERGARIVRSIVHPDTFVGRHVSLENSIAQGATVIDWRSGSCLRVPDAFLLGPLDRTSFTRRRTGLLARALALLALLVTAPLALITVLLSVLRVESPLRIRLGVRPPENLRDRSPTTFAYYELASGGYWVRRWPQFWSIVRGDLAWVGNRPLRPTEAFALVNDFERLWLATPPGLVSLADACGCPEGVSAESCAHASFYATNASRRLDAAILGRTVLRAATTWPLRWSRRQDTAAPLPQLVPKQQG
jgi:hypothetical protein